MMDLSYALVALDFLLAIFGAASKITLAENVKTQQVTPIAEASAVTELAPGETWTRILSPETVIALEGCPVNTQK